MNEQTAQLIRELADKLGTTGEHLWGVLVAQAPLSSASTFIVLTIWLLTGIFLLRYGLKTPWEDEFEPRFTLGVVSLIVCSVILLVTGIGFCMEAPMIMAGFFNPEYWALKQILK